MVGVATPKRIQAIQSKNVNFAKNKREVMKSMLILILIFFIFSCDDKPMIIEPLIMPYFKTECNKVDSGSAKINGVMTHSTEYSFISSSIGFTIINYENNPKNNLLIDNFVCQKKDSMFKLSDQFDIQFFKKSKITNSKHLSEVQPRDLDRYSFENDFLFNYSFYNKLKSPTKSQRINGEIEIPEIDSTSCLFVK
jgi:hypothetical protein